jgi:hypothetical protein
MTISISTGRDYTTYSKYEYVVFADERVVARKGGFSNSSAAKRAGIKAAQSFIQMEG